MRCGDLATDGQDYCQWHSEFHQAPTRAKQNLEKIARKNGSLAGYQLQQTDLQDANLIGADLEDAKLQRAGLAGAHLYGVKLHGADLFQGQSVLCQFESGQFSR